MKDVVNEIIMVSNARKIRGKNKLKRFKFFGFKKIRQKLDHLYFEWESNPHSVTRTGF